MLFVDIIGHFANAIYAIGSSFRDMIWLRAALVSGATLELYYDFKIAEDPLWTNIFWCGVLVLLNLFHITKILVEKGALKISSDEERLYRLAFAGMDKLSFKELLSAGDWVDMEAGGTFVRENGDNESLSIILDGNAEVTVGGQAVTYLGQGRFIGEMSFLTDTKPTATVTAIEKCKIFRWNTRSLNSLLKKKQDIDSELKRIFSADLVSKLIKHNGERSRVPAA